VRSGRGGRARLRCDHPADTAEASTGSSDDAVAPPAMPSAHYRAVITALLRIHHRTPLWEFVSSRRPPDVRRPAGTALGDRDDDGRHCTDSGGVETSASNSSDANPEYVEGHSGVTARSDE